MRIGFVCAACGEHVAQPLERGGHFYHDACWFEIEEAEAARETPEERRRGEEEDAEREE